MAVTRGLVFDAIFYEVAGLRILKGSYLHVRPGQVCGLVGRNGCGKTTLLKIGAGQLRPTSGLVIIDGDRLHRPLLRRRFAHIAYLPQDAMLPGELRVASLLRAFALPAEALRRDELLAGAQQKRVAELSGGQRRYLELTLILNLGRRYFLLDEPFTGLSPVIIDRMTAAIEQAARTGAGVLLTDHYHQYLLPIVDDAYLMDGGQCYHLDATGHLKNQLAERGYFNRLT